MSRETGIQNINPQSMMRQRHVLMNGDSVLTSAAGNHFSTDNITGIAVWVKATSVAGTPKYTLSIQTSPDETDANFVTVDPMVKPDFGVINDENPHCYIINGCSLLDFARFYVTLGVGDGGDDKFYIVVNFLYGNFTHSLDVTLEAGAVTLGDIRQRDGTTATNYTDINPANTARSVATKVMAVQNVDAEGHVPDWSDLDDIRIAVQVMDDWDESDRAKVNPVVGQAGVSAGAGAVDAATQRTTLASDDAHFGAVGAAADPDGVIHAQLRSIAEYLDALPASLGASAMAASLPVTLATDDTHFGAVGCAADPDGVIHGQLRAIAEGVDNLPAALGVAASAASLPVVTASDDAQFGAVGEAASATGGLHAQLRAIYDSVETLEAREFYKIAATGAGAIATTSAAAHLWELNSVTIHFDTAPATSENLDISIDSTDGAAYDTKLLTVDPSTGSLGDITFVPCNPLLLAAGDEIKVVFPNTDTRTYGVRIVGTKLA